MGGTLRRWVDLRQGERAPVFAAMSVLFGLIAAHTMLETARDALFLGHLPPSRLSLVYALLAALSIPIAKVNGLFVRRFGKRNALVITLMAAAYGTAMLYLAPRTATLAFVLYVWSGLLGMVLTVQFWSLAGTTFTVAQGKRIFGPLAAGGVIGAVTGASIAAVVLRYFEIGSLLLIAPLLLIGSAAMLTDLPSDQVPEDLEKARTKQRALPPVGRDPYLARIAILVVLTTTFTLTADYLFKMVTAKSMPAADLGQFLAGYYAVLNGLALLVQMFVTTQLIRRVGVVASLAFLPLSILLGAVGTILTGGALAAVLVTRGGDGLLRHSLHRVSSELLWMPVHDQLKGRAKALIDTAVNRGAQAVVGGLLLFLAMFGLDTPPILAAIIAASSIGALFLIMQLRRLYFELFRRALARDTIGGDLGELKLDLNSVEMVIESLSSREPERALAAIDLLVAQERTKLIPALILYHESEAVLTRALEVITSPERNDWVELAERLLSHESEAVRVAAVRALVASAHHEMVVGRLTDISPAVRAHTAFVLVEHDALDPTKAQAIKDVLDIAGENRVVARNALLDAICLRGDEKWAPIIELIAVDAPDALNEKLADAMVKVHDERFIPILIARIGAREGRISVRRAIVSYGDAALDQLDRLMADPKTPRRTLLHVPRTISAFKTPRAAQTLIELVSSASDGAVRFKALRGLGRLVGEAPVRLDQTKLGEALLRNLLEQAWLGAFAHQLGKVQASLQDGARPSGALLLELLEDKQRQAMERVFRLLQILHRSEDLRIVHHAVEAGDRRTRANALEFLDALTLRYPLLSPAHEQSRELLRILVDDLSPEERIARAAPFMSTPPPATAEAALIALFRENDDAMATIAAHHALKLGIVSLTRAVQTVAEERPFIDLPEVARAV